MFLGEYQHSLDAKGRVILPAKYRDQLSGGAYVTKGRGGCLSVYTAEEFTEVADRAREASKRGGRELDAARSFFAGTAEVSPDKQGRIAIPQNLREYAGLDRDRDVTSDLPPAPWGDAVESPYSARFPTESIRGDIRAAIVVPGGWSQARGSTRERGCRSSCIGRSWAGRWSNSSRRFRPG